MEDLQALLVRWLVESRGSMTQAQFADLTGIVQSTISFLETGSREVLLEHVELVRKARKLTVEQTLVDLLHVAMFDRPVVRRGRGRPPSSR